MQRLRKEVWRDNGRTRFVYWIVHGLGGAIHASAMDVPDLFPRTYTGFGFHYPTPRYEGHASMACEYTASGVCYPDSCSANDAAETAFHNGGEEALYKLLEEMYVDRFGAE